MERGGSRKKRGKKIIPEVVKYKLPKLREDAKVRWLETKEILFILENHEDIGFTEVLPHKPPTHSWSRTTLNEGVSESRLHLRVLKINPERILTHYYAYGNENPFLQRRIYRRTNPDYSHIVLVHYRDTSEGLPSSSKLTCSGQSSCSPGSIKKLSVLITTTGEAGEANREIVGCSNDKANDNSQQFGGNSGEPTLEDPHTIERHKKKRRSIGELGSQLITTNGEGTENYDRFEGWELTAGEPNKEIVGCSIDKANDNSQQFAGNSSHPALDPQTIERLKSSDWLRWVQLEQVSDFTDVTETIWEQEEDDLDINLWSF